MTERILNVKVGEPLADALMMAAQTMVALEQDQACRRLAYGIGFADVGQLLRSLPQSAGICWPR
ncbi:MAG: hypothetical protein U5J62_06340 [Desulfurivibrio sp.]|nr:hypothetical protein [Desulfurivibrio sp.]